MFKFKDARMGSSTYQQISNPQNENEDVEMSQLPVETSNKTVIRFGLASFAVALVFFLVSSMSGSNQSPSSLTTKTSSFVGNYADYGATTDYASKVASEVVEPVVSDFDSFGRYIFRNFDESKPMSNFLAGLGGFWGVPMWAFYVNRGQGITCFGIQNKDGPIAKFLTAEKAYQQTPFTGFRTFVKGTRSGESFKHMPFFPVDEPDEFKKPVRHMMIGMNEMEIEETASSHGLKTNVLYFTPPDEDFPSLVRSTTFTNLDTESTLNLDILDGLAKLIPSGLNDWGLNNMGRTLEAWMNIYNVGEGNYKLPFYHISQGTGDTSTVQIIKDGHFAVSFVENRDVEDGKNKPISFIVDPTAVFDLDTALIHPKNFYETRDFNKFMSSSQGTVSRTPCAFAGTQLKLLPGKSATVTTIIGHASNLEEFLQKILPKVLVVGYTHRKRVEANGLVQEITSKVATHTSSSIFDAYIKQDYLDNILRGGLPVPLGGGDKPKIYHTFSRIHGDLERDYNNFQIDTTYFSQGPGNFRDVNQNRRLDVLLQPLVGDFNIRNFLSLVQADGFNPLTVATTNFKVPTEKISGLLDSLDLAEKDKSIIAGMLLYPFRVGQFFKDMKTYGATFTIDRAEFLSKLVAAADQVFAASYNQNGFWADHWTYTLDLVENYIAVFPDKEQEMLFDSEPVYFFMSPSYVKPRHERYNLMDNPANPGVSIVRVINAVKALGDAGYPDARKAALEYMYSKDPARVSDQSGNGAWWQKTADGKNFGVSVISKLALLGILKFSTLDPWGMGVEMEGGKPGWNDAMNGLPGILGSGMPETYEMLRILKFVRKALQRHSGKSVTFPAEFADFYDSMNAALATYKSSGSDVATYGQTDFEYWDASNTARETYRESVMTTFSGVTRDISSEELVTALMAMEEKTQQGINRALALNSGLSPTYFSYESLEYEILTPAPTVSGGLPPPTQVKIKSFKMHTIPLFLEGPTRHFKVVDDMAARKEIYTKTKESNLYDKPLKMYTLSESLKEMSPDLGRMVAFAPGWLENQSVWLHMSYKFYLELLRAGMYEEFYTEIKTGLVPFMDNKVYGRSPLEAASFIVSSAFPDSKLHGSSFLARLSGSTAEFLSMWALMFAGPNPFFLDPVTNTLALKFTPALPAWLFTAQGTVSFTFLGFTKVTYYNYKKLDTWKMSPVSAVVTGLDGFMQKFEGGVIDTVTSERVRSHYVTAIDVYY